MMVMIDKHARMMKRKAEDGDEEAVAGVAAATTTCYVHKQINNNPYTSFGFIMSLNDYRGLDVPTAKLFLIPTGKLMVHAGSSWFLLVVPAGRLCGSYWSAYDFFC
ncbi:hypothetical protein Tco_1103726 [Tanacetum coccineum]